jgi:hypothetical protein
MGNDAYDWLCVISSGVRAVIPPPNDTFVGSSCLVGKFVYYELPLLKPVLTPQTPPCSPYVLVDALSPVFMSLGHRHHRKHVMTGGRRRGDGARVGGGGDGG